MKPKGSNGSIRHSNLAGLGIKLTKRGAYAIKRPSGTLKSEFNIFNVQPAMRFAPAESPAKTILLPVT